MIQNGFIDTLGFLVVLHDSVEKCWFYLIFRLDLIWFDSKTSCHIEKWTKLLIILSRFSHSVDDILCPFYGMFILQKSHSRVLIGQSQNSIDPLCVSLSLHSLLWLERCCAYDAAPFLSVCCLPPGGMDDECRSSSAWHRPWPLIAMSSLASPEVLPKTMVASALQPVQHDSELRLGALMQRGWKSAVYWLGPCRRLAGIVSLAWPTVLTYKPLQLHFICLWKELLSHFRDEMLGNWKEPVWL